MAYLKDFLAIFVLDIFCPREYMQIRHPVRTAVQNNFFLCEIRTYKVIPNDRRFEHEFISNSEQSTHECNKQYGRNHVPEVVAFELKLGCECERSNNNDGANNIDGTKEILR
jgi:hypothetical protein